MNQLKLRRNFKWLIRQGGWDVVRYQPVQPAPLGIARLPIRTIMDLGAYDGDTARVFRTYYPEAQIHCFEPNPAVLPALTAWADTQSGKVQVHAFALSDQDGQANLTVYPDHKRSASLASLLTETAVRDPRFARSYTVPVNTHRLDDVADRLELADEVLVKIDVEGYQRQVLAGGEKLMQRSLACIVEVHIQQYYPGSVSMAEMIAMMEGFGLSYSGNYSQGMSKRVGAVLVDALFLNRTRLQQYG
jgi:FkbM family methyltransferase